MKGEERRLAREEILIFFGRGVEEELVRGSLRESLRGKLEEDRGGK